LIVARRRRTPLRQPRRPGVQRPASVRHRFHDTARLPRRGDTTALPRRRTTRRPSPFGDTASVGNPAERLRRLRRVSGKLTRKSFTPNARPVPPGTARRSAITRSRLARPPREGATPTAIRRGRRIGRTDPRSAWETGSGCAAPAASRPLPDRNGPLSPIPGSPPPQIALPSSNLRPAAPGSRSPGAEARPPPGNRYRPSSDLRRGEASVSAHVSQLRRRWLGTPKPAAPSAAAAPVRADDHARGLQEEIPFYSLVVSCQRHGKDPLAYLRDVLRRLPTMTNQDDLTPLTPAVWQPA